MAEQFDMFSEEASPLTITGMPIENKQLFLVSLGFVALMPALYAAFIWWGGRETGFKRWQVAMLPGAYAVFVAAVVFAIPSGQVAKADPAAVRSSSNSRR
jgi:cation:H+ antiporter